MSSIHFQRRWRTPPPICRPLSRIIELPHPCPIPFFPLRLQNTTPSKCHQTPTTSTPIIAPNLSQPPPHPPALNSHPQKVSPLHNVATSLPINRSRSLLHPHFIFIPTVCPLFAYHHSAMPIAPTRVPPRSLCPVSILEDHPRLPQPRRRTGENPRHRQRRAFTRFTSLKSTTASIFCNTSENPRFNPASAPHPPARHGPHHRHLPRHRPLPLRNPRPRPHRLLVAHLPPNTSWLAKRRRRHSPMY